MKIVREEEEDMDSLISSFCKILQYLRKFSHSKELNRADDQKTTVFHNCLFKIK